MDLAKKTAEVEKILEAHMGVPKWKKQESALDNLIRTILSQNTNDVNRDKAYSALKARFPTWEQVVEADPRDIAASIKVAGLSQLKSVWIRDILAWIQRTYGRLDLEFICGMNPEEVLSTFCKLKGIGVKTMSVVLMASCGKDIFPVDTHVHRICRRLRLVPANASAEKTFWLMSKLVPKGKAYPFHINLIHFGRTICKAISPKCPVCPLKALCEYYKANRPPTTLSTE